MKSKRPDLDPAQYGLVEGGLTRLVIKCFFAVYNDLAFGMFESTYRNALAVELAYQGLDARKEVAIEVCYRGVQVGHFRLDLLVENRVAVEVKSTELLPPNSSRQLLNYLRASHLDVGLLLHFGPEAKFHRLVSPRVLSRTRAERIRQLPDDP